jgi:hypothetical protein
MPHGLSTRFTLSIALLIFALSAPWLTAVPGTLTPSTYVSVAALLTALAAMTMKTYMSGRATDSMAVLLHEADSAPGTAPIAASVAGRVPQRIGL